MSSPSSPSRDSGPGPGHGLMCAGTVEIELVQAISSASSLGFGNPRVVVWKIPSIHVRGGLMVIINNNVLLVKRRPSQASWPSSHECLSLWSIIRYKPSVGILQWTMMLGESSFPFILSFSSFIPPSSHQMADDRPTRHRPVDSSLVSQVNSRPNSAPGQLISRQSVNQAWISSGFDSPVLLQPLMATPQHDIRLLSLQDGVLDSEFRDRSGRLSSMRPSSCLLSPWTSPFLEMVSISSRWRDLSTE